MIKKIAAQTMPWLAASSIAAALLLLAVGETLGLVATAGAAGPLMKGLGTSPLLWTVAFFMAAFVVAVLLAAHRTGCRAQPFRPATFLPALIGGGLLLHLLLMAYVQPSWGTDYLRYWQHAQEMVREHKYGGFSGPYYSRALLVPYVIVRLFGPDATLALKLANVALLAGIQLFAYDILRRVRSHQAAQAASLLLLAAPMPAFATLIPSHDLWGLFFFAATLWTLTRALFPGNGRTPHVAQWLPLSLVAGVLVYLTELQRGTGTIFSVALVLSAALCWVCSKKREEGEDSETEQARARAGLLVAILCLCAMLVAANVGGSLGLNPNPRTSLFMMKIAANSGGMGSGTSDWYARFRDRFGEEQATDESATDFARSSALSAWTLDPGPRLLHVTEQAERLFELHYPTDWDWMLRHPKGMSKASKNLLLIYAAEYAIGFGVLFISALWLLATSSRKVPLPILAPLVAVLLLAITLLVLFENKPFNIFPVWLAATLAIGVTIARGPPVTHTSSITKQRLYSAASGLALAAGAILIPVTTMRLLYSPSSGQFFSDWSFQTNQQTPGEAKGKWQNALLGARPEAFDPASYDPSTLSKNYIKHSHGDGQRIQTYAGSAVTRIQFPAPPSEGDYVLLSTRVCSRNPGRRALEFFVFSPAAAEPGTLAMTVSVDGTELEHFDLPFAGRNFQRFVLPRAVESQKCQSISFRMVANRGIRNTKGNPFVELWMPRLAKSE